MPSSTTSTRTEITDNDSFPTDDLIYSSTYLFEHLEKLLLFGIGYYLFNLMTLLLLLKFVHCEDQRQAKAIGAWVVVANSELSICLPIQDKSCFILKLLK